MSRAHLQEEDCPEFDDTLVYELGLFGAQYQTLTVNQTSCRSGLCVASFSINIFGKGEVGNISISLSARNNIGSSEVADFDLGKFSVQLSQLSHKYRIDYT